VIRGLATILIASATPVVADVPFLGMPLDCVLGETCVIEYYPDVDPSPTATDYRCGAKSRDGHSGTDFALLTFEQMQDGVPVIAAADGRVEAIRNAVPDQPYVPGSDLNGQECGNAVRINHGNGYQTTYCHMRLGSVRVSPGQRVLAGQVLGEVGLSGKTNFPHLHLTVTQGSAVVDPFAPDQTNACNESVETLWRQTPDYVDAGMFSAGISDAVPDIEDVQTGEARRAALTRTDSIVLYGHAFNGNRGDTMDMTLIGPLGQVFEHTARLETASAELFRAFGSRPPSTGWPIGNYRGYVVMKRGGTVLSAWHVDLLIK
jgi:hypothetical protein